MPLLKVHGLTVRYGDYTALRDVSFSVEKGEIVAVIGPNGSGKTTLASAVMGLVPHSGEVIWDGEPRIGYVPQRLDFDRSFPLTVEELMLLRLPENRFWRHDEEAHATVVHALRDVGASKLIEKQIGTLSGGELQRVLIANALLPNPTILVLDEPSSGIDIEGEETIYGLIHRIADEREMTVLLVSHDLDIVFRHADQVVCLNRKLICKGVPQKVLTPEAIERAFSHPARYRHDGHGGKHDRHGHA